MIGLWLFVTLSAQQVEMRARCEPPSCVDAAPVEFDPAGYTRPGFAEVLPHVVVVDRQCWCECPCEEEGE